MLRYCGIALTSISHTQQLKPFVELKLYILISLNLIFTWEKLENFLNNTNGNNYYFNYDKIHFEETKKVT